MKFFIFIPLFFLSCITATAQSFQPLPAYGKVSPEELKSKECPFDKTAGAMVIFDEAESFFKIFPQQLLSPILQQTEHHVRIKIYNNSGYDQGNIKIRYLADNPEISIKNLSAQTYNLDAGGNIVVSKLDKSTVYDRKINKRYSEKIFVFPDVKEGSVLEYSYILDGASESKWYFQRSIPVQYSRFIIRFPQELDVSVLPYCNLPLKKGKDLKSDGEFSWYTMENLPGIKDEPFMSCREDYLQRLELKLVAIDFPGTPRINLLKTWPGIIKNLIEDEDFGRQLKKNIPRTADLDVLLQNVKDDYTKMRVIHKYVRNNMLWNNYDNIWALEGVKTAWKNKKGTSGEINLILINLLKDAGLTVHPVLVSTRDNGIINTSMAGYSQFNKVLAYVQIGDKEYVLDATEKNTPSHLIPLEVMASEGLLINKPDNYEWGWKVLWDPGHLQKNTVLLNAEIDEQGLMKGSATVKSYDYEKIKRLQLFKEGADKLKANITAKAAVKVDSLVLEDADNDSLPLSQNFNFSVASNASGDYHYFSTNLFAGLDKNLFIADDRKTDIFFGVKQEYVITGNIFLPEGYQMEDLPKNTKLITSDTSIVFKRYSSFSDGLLSVNVSLEFRNPLYTTDNYMEFKEFYKKLFNMLEEKYVYKKK